MHVLMDVRYSWNIVNADRPKQKKAGLCTMRQLTVNMNLILEAKKSLAVIPFWKYLE